MNIEELREKRLKFLMTLYQVTQGNELSFVSIWDIGKSLGFSRQETFQIAHYLKAEFLL